MAEILTDATYTGNGTNKTFSVPFEYLSKEHVHVYVDYNEVLDFSWNNEHSIELKNVPDVGIKIRVRRITPYNTQFIQWIDGTVLVADDLNAQNKQILFILQESQDALSSALKINTIKDAYDFKGNRLTNIGDPIDASDALTFDFLKRYIVQFAQPEFQAILQAYVDRCKGHEDVAVAKAAQAVECADRSCACADASKSWYDRFSLTVQPYIHLFRAIAIADGGKDTTYAMITTIADGGNPTTVTTIATIKDGQGADPQSWTEVDGQMAEIFNPHGIKDISAVDDNGNVILTVE